MGWNSVGWSRARWRWVGVGRDWVGWARLRWGGLERDGIEWEAECSDILDGMGVSKKMMFGGAVLCYSALS